MKEKLSEILATIKNRYFLRHCVLAVLLISVTVASVLLVTGRRDIAPPQAEEVFEQTPELPEQTEQEAEEIQVEEEEKEPEREYIPVGDIRIPHCGDIHYVLSTKTSDFYFENPSDNSCYLKVSITRLDTKETIYSSTLISPGNSISAIGFSGKLTKQGNYDAMVKVDAYALDRMVHLNSLAIDTVIFAY